MPYDALEQVKLRNNFYRDSYRKLAAILLMSIFINVVLVLIVTFYVTHPPQPKYFATTQDGRIIKLVPLNQPNLNDQAVLQWSSQAVTDVFNYDFVNFRQSLQSSKQYFTDNGWRGFTNALNSSDVLNTVQQQKLVVSAVLTAAPIILSQYELGGRYTWKVQMPITLTFQSSTNTFAQNWMINLTIQRISTLDNVAGVGIDEFVAQRQE